MDRIYHTWEKWECYPSGFFEDKIPRGLTKEEGERQFALFFQNLEHFEQGLKYIFEHWPNSCEHNLTNENLNRIAWLGQAACCAMTGLPSSLMAGYSLLADSEQSAANDLALKYLNIWLTSRGHEATTGERKHKVADLY